MNGLAERNKLIQKTQTHNSNMCSITILVYVLVNPLSLPVPASCELRVARRCVQYCPLLEQDGCKTLYWSYFKTLSIRWKLNLSAGGKKRVRKSTWAETGEEQPSVARCGRADSCNPPRRAGAQFTRHQSCRA